MPAKAGIHASRSEIDSRFRGNDPTEIGGQSVSNRRALYRIAAAALMVSVVPLLANAEDLARFRELLRQAPLVDGHNDLPWALRDQVQGRLDAIDLQADSSQREKPLHTDIPRLLAGGMGAQFWSVYVPVDLAGPAAVVATFEQIDLVHRMATRYPETFEVATTAADIERIVGAGKIASLIGMEGGHSIDNSLAVLRRTYEAGARYMTLTHWKNTDWADAATDAPQHGGLTEFGRELIREMNRLGMLVDLSHVSAETMNDVLDVAAAPAIFSHSSAHGLVPHPRNVPDTVLQRLKTTDGVVMVTFVPSFVSEAVRQHDAAEAAEKARLDDLFVGNPEGAKVALEAWKKSHPAPKAQLSDVADHIDHVKRQAGIDHIGIGGDLDGITVTVEGLDDVSDYPTLFAELSRRGYSDQDLKKIAGGNVLRVMRKAEEVAARLRKERPASEARIKAMGP